MEQKLRQFCWVGRNKHFNEISVSDPMTTDTLLKGDYWSFFNYDNRGKGGNCEFMMEIFEGDTLRYITTTGMSDMVVKIIDGQFVGVGGFTTYPLTEYFNALDFISMEIVNE